MSSTINNTLLIHANQQIDYCYLMKKRGNYIKEIRLERGYSAAKLADMINTTPQQISFLELGKRRLTWEWIQRLANALECHPMEITEGPGDVNEPAERELVQKFRGMSETDREKYISMADIFLSDNRKEKK